MAHKQNSTTAESNHEHRTHSRELQTDVRELFWPSSLGLERHFLHRCYSQRVHRRAAKERHFTSRERPSHQGALPQRTPQGSGHQGVQGDPTLTEEERHLVQKLWVT